MTGRRYPALAAAARQFIARSGEDQSAVAFADFVAEAARVCEQHSEPNPLCHVQQARPPIRSIALHPEVFEMARRSNAEWRSIEISPAESHRNLVTGCAFILAAAIVAIGLWVVLIVWLLG